MADAVPVATAGTTKTIIASMRQQSYEQQKHKQMDIMDAECRGRHDFTRAISQTDLIHGHTIGTRFINISS